MLYCDVLSCTVVGSIGVCHVLVEAWIRAPAQVGVLVLVLQALGQGSCGHQ